MTEQTRGPTGPTGPSGVATSEPSRAEAVSVVERFYRLLNAYRYEEAWASVPPPVRVESGGYAEWKAGYRTNISSTPGNVRVDSLTAKRAVISLELDSTDMDACTGNRVELVFAGTWTLAAANSSWEPVAASFDRVSGETPAVSASDCGTEPVPSADDCTAGYSPCLAPARDYDCEGGTGDGPEYVSGPVQVSGYDRYELDDNNNGVGCE